MKQKKKKDAAEQAQSGVDDGHQCNGGGGESRPIKSALKRTGTGRKSSGSKSKRHVQFNENMNTFFESDYVIVIRDDDCDFDEEDFDFWSQHPCSCGDEACFQPWLDDEEARGLPFDPYEEQPATLSPPDGYKDGCPRHMPSSYDHHDDALTAAYSSDVAGRCCDGHTVMPPYYSVGCPASYMVEDNKSHTESTPPPRPKDEQPQLKATSSASGAVQSKPNTVCDTNASTAQPRCIVETITMTTVTERQIVQATKRPMQDGASENVSDKPMTAPAAATAVDDASKAAGPGASSVPADEGYVIIRLGNNTMVYNNRNPNSAVRQLFPSTKFVCPPTRIKETDDARLLNKYLITEDSLRAFDSRTLNGYKEPQSDDDDDTGTSSNLIRRTIERSTLRRNTSGKKKNFGDAKEISLIEKIRRLTCDSDEDQDETAKKADNRPDPAYTVLLQCESSTTSTSASAYKKLSDSLGNSGGNRYDHCPPDQQQPLNKPNLLDLCDGHSSVTSAGKKPPPPPPVRSNSSGKPFLTTLATACVSGNVHPSPPTMQESPPPQQCPPQPDVVAGTQQQPSASGQRQEELAAFVQQDGGRLDKIRKRYLPTGGSNASNAAEDEDDENDDYGFNRRPEVHGIRSGFSAQILIKNQPPQQRPANRPYYPTVDGQPDFVPQRYPPPQPTAVMKARIQSERPPPPSYPAATAAAQRSIIRVTHGQQQTIRVPYQAVGPVQVHLLTTAAAAAAAAGHPVVRHPNEYIVHQHGHARIHHGQQFVIARGTQTAAISTTRFYQLPPPPPSAMQSTSAIENQQQQLFKQTSPTRGRHVPQEFSDHNNISSVAQTPPPPPPKNPVMFYGMNV